LAIGEVVRELGLSYYLDGARLWNACVATGDTPAQIAAPFDLTSVAFSKGLGAPAGSVLVGNKVLIHTAMRHRRMLGGAMRQVGMFAAACDFALTHHFERLAEDHQNAQLIAERIRDLPGVQMASAKVPTNIVVFELLGAKLSATELVNSAKQQSLLINALGPRKVRLLTHLDVSRAQCIQAAEIIIRLLE
jgi:threonine aldolase